MPQSDNDIDTARAQKQTQSGGDRHQSENRPKLSILAALAFVASILSIMLLGIVLHRVNTAPDLAMLPLQSRKFYEFWENLCVFKFAPAAAVLSILALLRVWLSRGKVGGLKLAVASIAMSVGGYALFWLIWFLGATWNA